MKNYSVYILGNWNNKVLYIGVTNSLERRLWEHKTKKSPNSFSAKYNCTKLLWYDSCPSIAEAISAEKRMKKWKRKWKEKLIQKMNPDWKDLSEEWESS